MAAIDLCTLQDVRAHAQYPADDADQDEVVEALITSASRAIMRAYRREFAPAGTAGETRTLSFDPRMGKKITVAPWDLRVVTAVTLDQGLSSQEALTTSQWRLCYHDPPNRVWRGVELEQADPVCGLFTERTITITGTWGFAEIPEDAAEACVLAVIARLRGDINAFGSALQPNSFGDGVNAARAFPPGVRGLLEPFQYDIYYV